MKNKISGLILLIVALANHPVFSQEVLFPLNENADLVNHAIRNSAQHKRFIFNDTLSLPFVDDFSRPGVYPFDSLWLDSGVYINNHYSELPVTIGVATFDGLNQYGHPYQPGASADSIADFLTSRPIDLVVAPGDTSVWLSFFYQPQGLGDPLEAGDSLVLQFKDTGSVWNTVWSVDGRSDTTFQRVNIRVEDSRYLFRGFQFRFYNIVTVNGNRDHWNLDYLILKDNTVANAEISDYAMVGPIKSLLTEYTAMPYSHYKSPGPQATAMDTSVNDSIYNIYYGGAPSFFPGIEILEQGNPIPIYSFTHLAIGGNVLSYIPYSLTLNNFFYPSNPTDSADFLIKSYVNNGVAQQNKYNDTSYYYQHFYNYYSYDDGSAEVAYGLTGNADVSMAYQFNIKIPDTLRGVQIYFNPTGVNVANRLFQLTVWSNVDLGSNSSVELYRMIDQKPDTFEGINAFKTYLFDIPLVIPPGNIWVGIIQNEPGTQYGIGLDKNIDSHNKMFYHLDGNWFQSAVKGSWMIRPLFGKKISLVGINEIHTEEKSFSVYPNPSTGIFKLKIEDVNSKKYCCEVFDCLGRIILSENLAASNEINLSAFDKGIYFVRLVGDDRTASGFRKLVLE